MALGCYLSHSVVDYVSSTFHCSKYPKSLIIINRVILLKRKIEFDHKELFPDFGYLNSKKKCELKRRENMVNRLDKKLGRLPGTKTYKEVVGKDDCGLTDPDHPFLYFYPFDELEKQQNLDKSLEEKLKFFNSCVQCMTVDEVLDALLQRKYYSLPDPAKYLVFTQGCQIGDGKFKADSKSSAGSDGIQESLVPSDYSGSFQGSKRGSMKQMMMSLKRDTSLESDNLYSEGSMMFSSKKDAKINKTNFMRSNTIGRKVSDVQTEAVSPQKQRLSPVKVQSEKRVRKPYMKKLLNQSKSKNRKKISKFKAQMLKDRSGGAKGIPKRNTPSVFKKLNEEKEILEGMKQVLGVERLELEESQSEEESSSSSSPSMVIGVEARRVQSVDIKKIRVEELKKRKRSGQNFRIKKKNGGYIRRLSESHKRIQHQVDQKGNFKSGVFNDSSRHADRKIRLLRKMDSDSPEKKTPNFFMRRNHKTKGRGRAKGGDMLDQLSNGMHKPLAMNVFNYSYADSVKFIPNLNKSAYQKRNSVLVDFENSQKKEKKKKMDMYMMLKQKKMSIYSKKLQKEMTESQRKGYSDYVSNVQLSQSSYADKREGKSLYQSVEQKRRKSRPVKRKGSTGNNFLLKSLQKRIDLMIDVTRDQGSQFSPFYRSSEDSKNSSVLSTGSAKRVLGDMGLTNRRSKFIAYQ